MKPSTIRYFIREGLSGLKMNMLMTMASIVAVAACISILSFSYCVGSNLRYMLGQMEDSIGISVFLKGDLSGEQIENMKDEIAKIDHVQSVEYISPSDALVELKKDWGADEDIFVGLDGENNPLSHSFSISLDNIENQQLYQVLIKVDRLTLQAILLQIQGYSIAEIAAILGMKEDTVYKRLGRLKQKIKKLLG